MHRHKQIRNAVHTFSGPVSKRQNEAAHGCLTIREYCSCGAIRMTNVNGRHVERGTWHQQAGHAE